MERVVWNKCNVSGPRCLLIVQVAIGRNTFKAHHLKCHHPRHQAQYTKYQIHKSQILQNKYQKHKPKYQISNICSANDSEDHTSKRDANGIAIHDDICDHYLQSSEG